VNILLQRHFCFKITFFAKVLAIRKHHFGENHVLVAHALYGLVSIREAIGIVDLSNEKMVLNAIVILGKLEGQDSPNVQQFKATLNRIREKRKALESPDRNSDNSIEIRQDMKFSSDIEKAQFLMGKANICFREQKFKQAEPMLEEALEIFTRDHGSESQSSRAALQNLLVTRNQILNVLWQEVVREEIEKIEEMKKSGEDVFSFDSFSILDDL